MQSDTNDARALPPEDVLRASRLAARLLQMRGSNFVERPWGGTRMHEYKGVARGPAAARIGEAFEIAAFDADEEARQHPSVVSLPNGSEIPLPRLLEAHAEALLGADFVARFGRCWPLLPKTLDVGELLSVQAHPQGNTEAYLIIAADPGATIRLGFSTDVDAAALGARLDAGRRDQQALLEALTLEPAAVQAVVQPWLAERSATPAALEPRLRGALAAGARWEDVEHLLRSLHSLYWHVLGLMNEIPVSAGQVFHNANPPRVAAAAGREPSAEVHALGNPEGREILALEIRRPGPTFRAWDNVRFPLRDVDSAAALAALNLQRTAPEDFIAPRVPVPNRPGVFVSVDSAHFRIEHLHPTELLSIDVPAEPPHSLHALRGAASVFATDGELLGRLAQGAAAIVPIGAGAYRVVAESPDTEVVKVSLPDAR